MCLRIEIILSAFVYMTGKFPNFITNGELLHWLSCHQFPRLVGIFDFVHCLVF
jgi:hypothetical protein